MILGFVRKVICREGYHPILTYPWFLIKVLICRFRYWRIRTVVSSKTGNVCVAFITAGPAKWKCQSVYDELARNGRYSPIVICNDNDRDFYERLGCVCAEGFEAVRPDIVFYQDPWSPLSDRYPVWEMSRTALCCYIPYSVETISQGGRSERFDYHHMAHFHSLMYAIFQWSEEYARHYWGVMNSWELAGKTYGFGHPALDPYFGHKNLMGDYVIYAPHFAFPFKGVNPIESIGTFAWSGELLLEYARRHREMHWLFKPHPKLRDRLVEIGYWSKRQVDDYYKAWEEIGAACYDGNYAKWFLASRAMITDSNSFLVEYMAVGRPLIHLVPQKTNAVVCAQTKALFETFYVARSEDELMHQLHLVLEQGMDPDREARMAEAKRLSILDNCAARRIVNWME